MKLINKIQINTNKNKLNKHSGILYIDDALGSRHVLDMRRKGGGKEGEVGERGV